jgi:peptide/nickel transport system substrate-binding protein
MGALVAAGSCRGLEKATGQSPAAVLRVGLGQAPTNPQNGVRQITMNLSVESLGRLAEDGRVEPQLADKWTLGRDGRSLTVTLKHGVSFHDGSPVNARTVSPLLPAAMKTFAGPVFDDIESITPGGDDAIEMRFRKPSPLLLEALEVQIRKPGAAIISTGAFMSDPASPNVLRANAGYYGGRPQLVEVDISSYPSVRTAWAELLRNRIDMLYEVGPDALDSLESSTNIAVFKFTRRYQYAIILNTNAPALRSSAVRRALNLGIDRDQLVRRALNAHGLPSSSPVWPRYWAADASMMALDFDAEQAATLLKSAHVRFTCDVPSDQLYERVALEAKRQLAAVGVDMEVRPATQDEIFERQRTGKFEALLFEVISGPTMLRPYQLWHSKGAQNPGSLGNATVDAAFDRVRQADDEAQFKAAVAGVQQAFRDDPPALFLVWTERARAVSQRFAVPEPEPGADVLRTLRMWTPRNDRTFANRN